MQKINNRPACLKNSNPQQGYSDESLVLIHLINIQKIGYWFCRYLITFVIPLILDMKRILLFILLLICIRTFSQYNNQTVGFKENLGQITDQKDKANTTVKYLLTSPGLNVQLRENGFSYDIYEVKKIPAKHSQTSKTLPYQIPERDKETLPGYTLEYTFHRIDIDFVNSNPNVKLVTDQPTKDFENYYNILTKPEGVIEAHKYKEITYKNIYPNIDIVFAVPNDPKKTVEYNFVIHPNGKISDIQLKFNGVETDLVDKKIQMKVRFGVMQETLPASWTEESGNKRKISVGYKKIKSNLYGFETSDSVGNKTVIIDPVPIRLWGTYYGGEGFDTATFVFTKGNYVYLSGTTLSKANIASNGAHQNTFVIPQASYDSFFAKFNSDGTIIWATYYGGNREDNIFKISVSNNDNIYIGGASLSTTNIATPASHQEIKGSVRDGFLAKFNTDGVRQWATYYGGMDDDEIRSIEVDPNENIYIFGTTFSKGNIATAGSHQPSLNNLTSHDGFVAKFDSTGIREWGTYYGGAKGDIIYDSKLDSKGNIIFLGSTFSNNNISTPNSFKETHLGSDREGFLAKLDSDGNRIWATYFGGNKTDYFHDLEIDSYDNFYCFGQTQSTTEMSTSGVFQENIVSNGSDSDGCIIKFNPSGFKIWGSYFFPEVLGGSVSKDGAIYFTGRVKAGFSSTPNTYQEFPLNNTPGTDSYLVKFSTSGQRQWATYFGGEAADNAVTTALDDNHNIYLAGGTQSLINIATPDSHQPNYFNSTPSNSQDAFLVKFQDCESQASAASNSPICLGQSLELKASGGTNYTWSGPNGFASTVQNPLILNAKEFNSGDYNCIITGSDICNINIKLKVVIGDIQAPVADLATLPAITGDCHIMINVFPTATDLCAGAIIGTTTSPLSYSIPGTYTVIWNYSDGNGNSSTQNQIVNIQSQPLPSLNPAQIFCSNQNATIDDIAVNGQNLKWYDTLTSGSILPGNILLEDSKTYYVSQSFNGCESARIPVLISLQDTSAPTGNANQVFCSGQNPTLQDIKVTGENIKWYSIAKDGLVLPEKILLQDGKTYFAAQTINSCESQRLAVTVTIRGTPVAPTGDTKQQFCKSENATLNNINIKGQNLKWYDSKADTVVLENSTMLQNGRTYYVSQTIGCESEKFGVLVNVHLSILPVANTQQYFCNNENVTLSSITITGQNLKWYDALISGNILNNNTLLESRTYYATQTVNNCESSKLAITVKIQDTPSPIADADQHFCVQQNATLNSVKASGQNIKWYNSGSAGINLPESTRLENGMTYYATQTINNCESNERAAIHTQILEQTDTDCLNLEGDLPFPKFFTPNNDGYNDTWTVDPIYLSKNSSIKIFDRYGKLLKELSINSAWDGTYIGQNLPSSDYWFVVTRLDGSEFKSHFSLKR